MARAGESLEVTRDEGATKGRYVVRLDGSEGEMTYSRAGERLIIIGHTGVPDALRGKGVGEALVRRGVEDARAEGRLILPLCPGPDRAAPGMAGRAQALTAKAHAETKRDGVRDSGPPNEPPSRNAGRSMRVRPARLRGPVTAPASRLQPRPSRDPLPVLKDR